MSIINTIIEFKKKCKTDNPAINFIRIDDKSILIQIFKSETFSNYGWDIKLKDSYLFVIDFNKGKKNNSDNFSRFIKSEIYASFKRHSVESRHTYFIEIKRRTSAKKIQKFIIYILLCIYDYKLPVEYEFLF